MTTLSHMESYRRANKTMGLVAANVFVATNDREKVTLFAEQLRLRHYKAMYLQCEYMTDAVQVFIKKHPPALIDVVVIARLATSATAYLGATETAELVGKLDALRTEHNTQLTKMKHFDTTDASDELWSEAAMKLNIVAYEFAIYTRFLTVYSKGGSPVVVL